VFDQCLSTLAAEWFAKAVAQGYLPHAPPAERLASIEHYFDQFLTFI
jgi:hypothetical protein